MCGRIDLQTNQGALIKSLFIVENKATGELGAHENVPPSKAIPVIVALPDGRRCLERFRWGMPPFESKQDDRRRGDLINIRSENLLTFQRYREGLKQRRCVIPAGCFYEWKHEEGKKKGRPYRFTVTDGLMSLAGLWEKPTPGHSDIRVCAIITCEPNELVAEFYDRMPVILNNAAVDVWLDPAFDNSRALQELMKPYPADKMQAVPGELPKRLPAVKPQPALDQPSLFDP
jgi:putative SOS response-associated peptidase YedK